MKQRIRKPIAGRFLSLSVVTTCNKVFWHFGAGLGGGGKRARTGERDKRREKRGFVTVDSGVYLYIYFVFVGCYQVY